MDLCRLEGVEILRTASGERTRRRLVRRRIRFASIGGRRCKRLFLWASGDAHARELELVVLPVRRRRKEGRLRFHVVVEVGVDETRQILNARGGSAELAVRVARVAEHIEDLGLVVVRDDRDRALERRAVRGAGVRGGGVGEGGMRGERGWVMPKGEAGKRRGARRKEAEEMETWERWRHHL